MTTMLQPDTTLTNAELHAALEAMQPPTPTPTPVLPDLTRRALLVSLHLRQWTGKVVDRRVTAEVQAEQRTSRDSGAWVKQLFPDSAFASVNQAHGRARAAHNRLTVPWAENAQRALNAAVYDDYSRAMAEHRAHCELAYREFLAAFPDHLAQAQARLGKTFHPDDFPTLDEVRASFAFELVVMPFPDKADFRVQLGAEQVAAMQAQIEQVVTTRFQEQQVEVFTRVRKALGTLRAVAANPKARVYDSTFEALREAAQLAPRVMLATTPEFTQVCDDIVQVLSGKDADTLRDSKHARRTTARELAALEAQLAGAL